MRKEDFLDFLRAKDFRGLFLECGWNNATNAKPFAVEAEGREYEVREAAQRGMKAYVCETDEFPKTSGQKALDARLRKFSENYLLVLAKKGEPLRHAWMVPVNAVEKRRLVTLEYANESQAGFLWGKIEALTFPFGAEPSIIDDAAKVQKAFLANAADVTKKFYQGFRKQHDKFVKGIENLADAKDREWYASVMLNRLMFCYFIQKKGFLDGDPDYLRRKLEETKKRQGEDKFYGSFYRKFLKHLFSDGLDKPSVKRGAGFANTFGLIPYLNGGMFAEHKIEKENAGLDVKDETFESLFAFFDEWRWHLDSRITESGKDVNPDVLGYIFEQYINDRAAMGAYYTKEDVTEYIGRNCILPHLFEAVKKRDGKPFKADGEVWTRLKESGDRYVFAAVKRGTELEVPANIAQGVDATKPDLRKRRADWNQKTPDEYALPTEIWRETMARRKRFAETKAKIEGGEITDIHDFITLNLDIRKFAEDLIAETKDHLFVRHFYEALRETTILDPTCGSGAFLFAALNILEPLYEACLERMEEFNAANGKLFKEELEEIAGRYRSNRQYFIYKNIILRNLYGVDIMHEATEIARLRLFLKMVTVVEADYTAENLGLDPLPDVDFNVKCGNTLVGFATRKELDAVLATGDLFARAELEQKIEDNCGKAAAAFKYFRERQLDSSAGHQDLLDAKREASRRLDEVRKLLDDLLYKQPGNGGKTKAKWLADAQPFHWYTEFYPIIEGKGGFDVIIGNPPYVKNSVVEIRYKLSDYRTRDTGNVYTCVIERTVSLLRAQGYSSFIVQLPLICTDGMSSAQNLLKEGFSSLHISSFDDRPAKLFSQLEHIRATIFFGKKNNGASEGRCKIYTTSFNRWFPELRKSLFQIIQYCENSVPYLGAIAKIGDPVALGIYNKLTTFSSTFKNVLKKLGDYEVYYHNAPLYWVRGTKTVPYFKNDRGDSVSGQIKKCKLELEEQQEFLLAVLNSSLFYLWFIAFSDTRHLNVREIETFPLARVSSDMICDLKPILKRLIDSYEKHKERKTINNKNSGVVTYDEYHPGASKEHIDDIDDILGEIYQLTQEEVDWVVNFNYQFRMGRHLRNEGLS